MSIAERHHQLLAEVVRSYVKAAEPVGSKALETRLRVSSATIRNDMATLEKQGYLTQPHTSAGRVPTPKGWQFYLEHLMRPAAPPLTEQRLMRDVLKREEDGAEPTAKELARQLAELACEAALVAFSTKHTYYTGLGNLFAQPEFSDLDLVRTMGRTVDHLDESLTRLWPEATAEVQVRLGPGNPFGEDCAVIFTNVSLKRQPVFLALLGPVRMDYDAQVGRMNYVTQLFTT